MRRFAVISSLFIVLLYLSCFLVPSQGILWAVAPCDPGVVVTGQEGRGRTTPDGKTFTNTIGMKFVRIPEGSFVMGSPSSEPGRYSNETLHRVTLTKPFYMQTTEVTVGQWRLFIRDSGYRTEAETSDGTFVWTGSDWKKQKDAHWDNPTFSQSEDHPVTCVSWNDCREFLKWLNGKEGEGKYRLPTEAEWEYACRAGTTTPFNGGNCLSASEANYDGNHFYTGCSKGQYRQQTVSVASFPPNAWGLFDTHGNVWEWCSDWYGDYPGNAVTDPEGPGSGTIRVLRGGSWGSSAEDCRSSYREWNTPVGRFNVVGFRVAWTK